MVFLSGRERTKIHYPTPTESLFSEIYAGASASGELSKISIVPVFILWRRHSRGGSRQLSEYLFGLSSHPNLIGKIWYLLRRRQDSSVSGLGFLPLAPKESLEKLEGFDENEAMRAAKSARRRILVWIQQEMRVLRGPRYHSPSLIKETVLRDPQIQELITRLSQERRIDRKRLMSEAYQDLTELVADYRIRFIEVVYVFLTWFFSHVFDVVSTKDEDWQEVREILKHKPVAFIPCHRSHLDYLVIPYLLFTHDMVTPHIAAGINLSFWPVGRLLRMAGAFFIRRTFRGDPLYHAIVYKYVETLLKNRYNVKFFIEGTRSRSGKMLAPAYGMLKMVMETYAHGVCEDVALIPVSICYDEIPEQGAYTREISGGQKTKENALGLLRSRKTIFRRFGKVYVRVAKPLYVREIYHALESDPELRLQKTAFQISKSICDVTPITPKSLISTVLLCYRNPAISQEEGLRCALQLADYAHSSGFELSIDTKEELKPALEQTLVRLRKSGFGLEWDSKKRTLLNFYKNNAAHCFVIPSIALLAYGQAWQTSDPSQGDSWDSTFQSQALLLRDILKFEFFFNPRAEFLTELERARGFLFDKGLRQRFAVPTDLSVFRRVIGELLESYLCFAQVVADSSEKQWEKKTLLNKALRYSEGRQILGEILFPEGMSVVNYGNALLYLENQGVLAQSKDGDKSLVLRVAQDGTLDKILDNLTQYKDNIQENEETFFSLN